MVHDIIFKHTNLYTNEIVIRKKNKTNCLIEIDGGVTDQNASRLISCGADVLVAGSYVFKAKDPQANIRLLKKA